MADTVAERLLILVEANSKNVENAMKRIERVTKQSMDRSSRSVAALDRSMKQVHATAGRLGGRLLAAFGVAAISRAVGNAGQLADNLVNVADRIGISTDKLQEWHHAAMLADVGLDEFDSSLDAFSKRLGDAARGTGELRDILKANNIPLRDAQGNLIGAGEQLLRYADLMAGAATEVDKATLSNAAFGRGNVEMQGFLSQGSRAIGEQADEAHDLGKVLDNDVLRRQAKLNDEFDKFTSTVGTEFQGVVLDIGQALFGAGENMGDLTEKVRGLFEGVHDNGELIAALAGVATVAKLAGLQVGLLVGAVAALWATVRSSPLNGNEGQNALDTDVARGGRDVPWWFDKQAARDRLAAQGFTPPEPAGAPEPQVFELPPISTVAPFPTTVMPTGGGGGEDPAQKIKDVIAELEFERAQLGRTNAEQEIYNRLKEAGVAADSEAGERIRDLVLANEAQAASMEKVKEQQEAIAAAWSQMGDIAGDVLDRLIVQGDNLNDVLRDVLKQLASQFIRAGISSLFGGGTNPLGAIFGNLFGGGRASGGPVSAGTPYMVGERGPELFIPNVNGGIVPKGANANAPPTQFNLAVVPSPLFQTVLTQVSVGAANVVVSNRMAEARDVQRRGTG